MFIPWFIRSFVRSFSSFFRSFVRSSILSSFHSLIRSFIHSFIHLSIHSFIHSFVNLSIHSYIFSFTRSSVRSFRPFLLRLFKSTIAQKRSRHSTDTVPEFHDEAPQATASEGLVQGPYVSARAGFDSTTLRLEGIDSTKAPPRPTIQSFVHSFVTFFRSPVLAFVQSFVRSFVPSFVHSLFRWFVYLTRNMLIQSVKPGFSWVSPSLRW